MAEWKEADDMEECMTCGDDIFPLKQEVMTCKEQSCKEYMCKSCATCNIGHHWETLHDLPASYQALKPTYEEALANIYCDQCKEQFDVELLKKGYRHCEECYSDICSNCRPVKSE